MTSTSQEAEKERVNKDALIIGSNAAGIQAAINLADSGIKVHLLEEAPFLVRESENILPGYLLNARLLEIARHPNIQIWTNTRVSRVRGRVRNFRVELHRHPRYVDITKCTACGECISVCPVIVPGTNHKAIYIQGQPGCMAIDKLGKPPCANTCPGGIHVQGYVALIAQGRFQEAIDLIRQAIPFPGICGRVCTHPCEFNCRRAEIDKPVAIRLLKRFVADWELEHRAATSTNPSQPSPPSAPANSKVAIVGAGPGGMAVAHQLAHRGYQVTVFEKLPVIGGMMAVGIPEYRLPRSVIAREYQQIQDLGVEIRLSTTIGPKGDYTLNDLFSLGYQAICLAVGAHKSQNLHIPGEELPGVIHGIDLLKTINLSQQLNDPTYHADLEKALRRGRDTRVAILGGGNTAMDVSRSIKRLGINDVRILYRRTRAEMPAMVEEIEDAELEGVKIEYLVSPVRVLGDIENGVTGLECIQMKLGEPDASGRRRPVPIADSEFVIDLDLVVLAIGQSPDLSFLDKDDQVAITRDERINVADISFSTSHPGIFAVGDAVTRDKMVVIEAIGMGKKAAAAIDAYLCGQEPHELIVDARETPISRREMKSEELTYKPRITVATISMEQRLNSYAEVELGYTAEQAILEAQRCLACGPCSECMECVKACKTGAIIHEQQESFHELNIGAILFADDPAYFDRLALPKSTGVYIIPPENALLGSAAAARAMVDLSTDSSPDDQPSAVTIPYPIVNTGSTRNGEVRIGVFVCRCGDSISRVIDTKSIVSHAASLIDVAYAQEMPFSCSMEAAQAIQAATQEHRLNRVVLAGCSCCSIDQVCYSCTYQRVRCKDYLNLFDYERDQSVRYVFANIREQCAWVHADNPVFATEKATAIVASAVARARAVAPMPVSKRAIDRSALILGQGAAARSCQSTLTKLGINVQQLKSKPSRILRSVGMYVVQIDETPRKASALVLTPRDSAEADSLLSILGREGLRLRTHSTWSMLETHRPGIFFCDFSKDPTASGIGAAAHVAAWLSRTENHLPTAAVVDPARCRACTTCTTVCAYGAPEMIEINGRLTSWIDPAICTGCGTCVARCSSGAITAYYSTDAQLEAMLGAILTPPLLT